MGDAEDKVFAGIYIFIIIINLYIGFHACFFFRALGVWCASRLKSPKIADQAIFPLANSKGAHKSWFLCLFSLKKDTKTYKCNRLPAWKLGLKLPLRAAWLLFLGAALAYLLIRSRGGFVQSAFRIFNDYWGALLAAPLLLMLDLIRLPRLGLLIFKLRPAFYAEPRFTLISHTALAALLAGIIGLGSWQARHEVVTRYRVSTEKPLPGGRLTVILVSDIHAGSMVKKKQMDRLVAAVNRLEGDIILLAGDIIDRANMDCIEEYRAGDLGRLKAPLGVWAITGNHEYIGGDLAEFSRRVEADGIRLLMDEAELIADAFYVIGRKDRSGARRGEGRKPLEELTEGLDCGLPLIVADHQPFTLEEAEASGVDLQVSGHTHNGQIWPGPLVIKGIYENGYGLLYKGSTAVVVSSGFGTWGPPLRIGTRAEIVLIELVN
jgi:predicted MPP superfamily phosphohydrolase